MNREAMLDELLKSLDKLTYIKEKDIPNIDLYMDQVTTFMEKRLRDTTRNPQVDKVLTKTMINNYAKNDLLPSPEKKKYSKEHMLLLIFIFYFKNILSISDIQTLFTPITEKFFKNGKADFNLRDIYTEVFDMQQDTLPYIVEDVRKKYELAGESFQDAPKEDLEFLQQFAFICELSFDVFVKKMLIEKMVDELRAAKGEEKPPVKEKKDKKSAKEPAKE